APPATGQCCPPPGALPPDAAEGGAEGARDDHDSGGRSGDPSSAVASRRRLGPSHVRPARSAPMTSAALRWAVPRTAWLLFGRLTLACPLIHPFRELSA